MKKFQLIHFFFNFCSLNKQIRLRNQLNQHANANKQINKILYLNIQKEYDNNFSFQKKCMNDKKKKNKLREVGKKK